jgi:hypothetical protein
VSIFGNSEVEEKYSLTSHIISRWRKRIGDGNHKKIKFEIHNIINNGIKFPIDESHYRICYNGICVVFMKLSPLHSLAKTVYKKDENELGV